MGHGRVLGRVLPQGMFGHTGVTWVGSPPGIQPAALGRVWVEDQGALSWQMSSEEDSLAARTQRPTLYDLLCLSLQQGTSVGPGSHDSTGSLQGPHLDRKQRSHPVHGTKAPRTPDTPWIHLMASHRKSATSTGEPQAVSRPSIYFYILLSTRKGKGEVNALSKDSPEIHLNIWAFLLNFNV